MIIYPTANYVKKTNFEKRLDFLKKYGIIYARIVFMEGVSESSLLTLCRNL